MSGADWQPVAGLAVARQRAALLDRARRYFATEGILEVDTPALSLSAVSDPNISSVPARLSMYPGQTTYLHTSPEYCMKRLLAAGFPDIGSICRVFRDGECGRRHQPEFTMIEWYRLGFGMHDIVDDTLRLIAALLEKSEWLSTARRMSYREACMQHAQLDPDVATIDEIAAALGVGDDLRRGLGDDRDAWLDLLMANRVVTGFDPSRLTCVHHYPASQAALARLCPTDPTVSDRFEIFCGDLELANGYVELTDAEEQRRRFDEERVKREDSGLPATPMDEALLESLAAGLPECAGVAVGLDRLMMLAAGTEDIRDVLHFPHETDR